MFNPVLRNVDCLEGACNDATIEESDMIMN